MMRLFSCSNKEKLGSAILKCKTGNCFHIVKNVTPPAIPQSWAWELGYHFHSHSKTKELYPVFLAVHIQWFTVINSHSRIKVTNIATC